MYLLRHIWSAKCRHMTLLSLRLSPTHAQAQQPARMLENRRGPLYGLASLGVRLLSVAQMCNGRSLARQPMCVSFCLPDTVDVGVRGGDQSVGRAVSGLPGAYIRPGMQLTSSFTDSCPAISAFFLPPTWTWHLPTYDRYTYTTRVPSTRWVHSSCFPQRVARLLPRIRLTVLDTIWHRP